MSPPEHLAKARNESALRESIRRAIDHTLVTLDLDKNDSDTLKSVISALRNVAQPLQIQLDMDVDASLGTVGCPEAIKAGVDWLIGKASR